MMPILSSNRRRSPRRGLFIKVILAALFILLVWWLRSPIASLAWRALTPVFAVRTTLSEAFGAVGAQFASKAALVAENNILRTALASSSAALTDRDLVYQEVLDLKARLGRNARQRTLLAGVVSRPPMTPYDTFIIDAGAQDGLAVGDTVAAGGTTVVGKISDVYATTARVILFSSSGESYDTTIQTKAGSTPFSIIGQGAGSLMGKVPSGTVVGIGDKVVLPGIEGGYVASVSAIDAPQNQSFITVYLQMPINPFSLSYVEVWHHATE